jgi:hypothetical protein
MQDRIPSPKSFLKSAAIFGLVYLVYKAIFVTFIATPSSNSHNSFYDAEMNGERVHLQLIKVVDSMNKLIPLRVDSLTEYTGVQLLSLNTLQLRVKLNIDSSKYNLRKLKKLIDSTWFKEVIMGETLKDMRDNDVSLIYDFFDMNNDSMFTLKYTPATYNKLYSQ